MWPHLNLTHEQLATMKVITQSPRMLTKRNGLTAMINPNLNGIKVSNRCLFIIIRGNEEDRPLNLRRVNMNFRGPNLYKLRRPDERITRSRVGPTTVTRRPIRVGTPVGQVRHLCVDRNRKPALTAALAHGPLGPGTRLLTNFTPRRVNRLNLNNLIGILRTFPRGINLNVNQGTTQFPR